MPNWELLAAEGTPGSVGAVGATGATGPAGVSGYKNALINGAMNIFQRGTSFTALAANSYTADRWKIGYVTSGVINVTQDTAAPPSVSLTTRLFPNALKIACTTADSSIAATDQMFLFQCIEGFNWQQFAQRDLVLSFYVKSSKTGTYSVAFGNNVDRTYVQEYTINSANTWEKKTLTISASPSAGTWNYSTGIGAILLFGLMAGSNFTTSSLNAWNSDTKIGSTNQVNFLDSNTATFFITGVQLEVGSTDTNFDFIHFTEELLRCQRYYWKTFPYATTPAQAASVVGALAFWASSATAQEPYVHVRFPVSMRIAPALTTYNPISANANWRCTSGAGSDLTAGTGGTSKSADTFFMVATTNTPATQGAEAYIHVTAEAEL